MTKAFGLDVGSDLGTILIFRTNGSNVKAYIPRNGDYDTREFDTSTEVDLAAFLPRIFTIDSFVALPDSIPIRSLAQNTLQGAPISTEALSRKSRTGLWERLSSFRACSQIFESEESVTKGAKKIPKLVKELLPETATEQLPEAKSLKLADDLICKVANIDREALADLFLAIRDGKEGHANAIISQINRQLARSLKFPTWWVQDSNFQLIVSPREFDLVFTIKDRTETEYSFGERSHGLKYFLSYYVQYRAHEADPNRSEILLMDEPDAYLSSQAQQDLLKIFEAFARPEDGRKPVQVIYVTHSPFLIDRNHAERIRVLEKGIGEEGTRVVKDAGRNHYEPLRSAFGGYVAETTFIGNCNLMVEGLADQVLLAGAATWLRRRGVGRSETLDLNRLTIVPVGSASSVPYMVYLARGRDVEKPAVVVLLDSDSSGNDARRDLKRSGARGKMVLKDEFVMQIGELSDSIHKHCNPVEIEDLVPLPLCAEAARRHALVFGIDEARAETLTQEEIEQRLTDGVQTFDALAKTYSELLPEGSHIEKVGLARAILDVINSNVNEDLREAVDQFASNMRSLFSRLNRLTRRAENETKGDRVSAKISRIKKSFFQDHPSRARREEARMMLDDIEASLDDSLEADGTRLEVARLRRNYALDEDLTTEISEFAKFQVEMEKVCYAGRLASQEDTSE